MSSTFEYRHELLPPPLRAALDEFVAWAQEQLLVEQDESTPTLPLYHYTGEEALKGILTAQQLWCFSHQHQRDQSEFQYSLAIARQVIKEIGQSEDFFTKHLCGYIDDLLEHNSLTETFDFYLFSLSRHRDDPQQWREYGRQGRGFAIGFAPALFLPNETELKEQVNENLHVGRVIYGDGATEKRHRRAIERAAEIASRVGRANIDVLNTVRPEAYLRAIALEFIASQLVWNCLTAKRTDFANEREVRYVIMGMHGKFDSFRKVHDRKDYIETPLALKNPGNLVKILVGPHAPADAEANVLEFLKSQGYPEGVSISRSTVSGYEYSPTKLDSP